MTSRETFTNNYNTNSSAIRRISINETINAELEAVGDHNWFAISLSEGESYEFNLIGNNLRDTYLQLRNENGDIITRDDDSGFGLNSRITFQPTYTGTYYLDAGSYQNLYAGTYSLSTEQTSPQSTTPNNSIDSGDAAFSISDSPSIVAILSAQQRSSDPNSDDIYSADRSTTGRIGIDETLNAELEEIGDRDWFAISLSEGENYEFNLIGNTLIDPYLYLRGESGSIISHNDDIIEGINRNSSLTFTPSNTEIYYLDVGAWQDNYTGSYALSTRRLPQSDPGFSAIDGWGEVSAKRAFERLLNITIPYVANLGGNLWGVDNVDAPEVWSNNSTFPGATGEGVTIAVIDTGVDLDHPEFNGRITDGYDFVDNDVIADDGHGHGTHIAGTIAGNNNDQIGISGVAPDAQIMPIRVLDNRGNGSIANVIEGIIWATDNGADVLNLSLGGGGYSQAMSDAIAYASSNNAVVVMAAGNSGGLSPDYPAVHAINHGIAVGALDQNRNMASFSNRAGNETLDYLTAPGVNIYSSVPNGSYSKMSGTSMATPHVAGIAALLKSHDSSLTANEIEDLLTGTASNAQLLSNREETTDSLTGSTIGLTRNLITLDTLDQFTQEQLGTQLIGKVKKSSSQTNEEIMHEISHSNHSIDIDSMESLGSTSSSFICLDLSYTLASANQKNILTNLLEHNQFEYFEIDYMMTTS